MKRQRTAFLICVLPLLAFALIPGCGNADDDDDGGSTVAGAGGASGGSVATGGSSGSATAGASAAGAPSQNCNGVTPVEGETCTLNGVFCPSDSGPCICRQTQGAAGAGGRGGRRGGGGMTMTQLQWDCTAIGTGGGLGTGGVTGTAGEGGAPGGSGGTGGDAGGGGTSGGGGEGGIVDPDAGSGGI